MLTGSTSEAKINLYIQKAITQIFTFFPDPNQPGNSQSNRIPGQISKSEDLFKSGVQTVLCVPGLATVL